MHTLLKASELLESTRVSLVVIQLTEIVALWWDIAGYNPWSLTLEDFTSRFLSRFAPLDPPPPPVLVLDPEMAMRYETLNRTIS